MAGEADIGVDTDGVEQPVLAATLQGLADNTESPPVPVAVVLLVSTLVLLAGPWAYLGWAVVRAFRDSGLDVFSLPLAQLIAGVSLLGTAAAALPARQAVRTDILESLAVE